MASKTQTTELKEAMKMLHGTSEADRLLHRLHSVVFVLRGHSASEAGRIFNDSPRAVAYWVTRFKKLGVKGLQAEPRPGRPKTLHVREEKQLQTFLKQQEANSQPVNGKTLSQFVKRTFKVDLTERHCSRILKRLKG